MTVVDHAVSGGLLGFALQPLFRRYLSKPKAVVLMMLAASLPDIDYVTRIMGRDYYYNTVNNLFLSHRGFFHSLGGILFFAAVVLICYGLFVSLPPYREGRRVLVKLPLVFGLAMVGGALHLFEDFLGPDGPWKGLVLFYPINQVRYPGLSLYGWYNFYTIYLFLAAFIVVWFLNLMAWIARVRPLWINVVTVVLVAATFVVAGRHIVSSPGYPEEIGFKKAEAVWKEYQLSILPDKVRAFSDKAQETGMATLFATIPSLKMEDYVKGAVTLIGTLVGLFLLHMIVYVVSVRWRKKLPNGSPVKNFLVATFLLVGLPAGGVFAYYLDAMPLRSVPEYVPVSTGFDYPVGDKNSKGWNGVDKKGWYVAQGFLTPFYHPGEDWNGKGGGNTDLGQPVYAVSEGRVIFAKEVVRWGYNVIIQHRLPNGEQVFSMYAHLKDANVSSGDIVQRRQEIGSVGRGYKGKTYRNAHLHFEVRRENMARYSAAFWPRLLTAFLYVHRPFSEEYVKEWITTHYYGPSKFIRNHRRFMSEKKTGAKKSGVPVKR